MPEYKEPFKLHPETLIEASEILAATEDAYESYLAQEMRMALEASDVEWREYVEDPEIEWGHRERGNDA